MGNMKVWWNYRESTLPNGNSRGYIMEGFAGYEKLFSSNYHFFASAVAIKWGRFIPPTSALYGESSEMCGENVGNSWGCVGGNLRENVIPSNQTQKGGEKRAENRTRSCQNRKARYYDFARGRAACVLWNAVRESFGIGERKQQGLISIFCKKG